MLFEGFNIHSKTWLGHAVNIFIDKDNDIVVSCHYLKSNKLDELFPICKKLFDMLRSEQTYVAFKIVGLFFLFFLDISCLLKNSRNFSQLEVFNKKKILIEKRQTTFRHFSFD